MPNLLPFRRRRRRWRPSQLWFAPLWLAAVLGGAAYGAGWLPRLAEPGAVVAAAAADPGKASRPSGLPLSLAARNDSTAATFSLCHTGGGYNCVVDGDTIWLEGEKIRVAGIDAPETHPPRCPREAELGAAATERLRELLNSGAVTTSRIDRDRDRYGRLLRNVAVDGSDVGDTLIAEGLARAYGSGRRSWC